MHAALSISLSKDENCHRTTCLFFFFFPYYSCYALLKLGRLSKGRTELMGKKLMNRLIIGFRIIWKASKLKPTLKLGMARLVVLKNHRKVRCSHSRSDVVQLLHLGHHDRALLRVEQVIKEQNMLDAYSIMENYLNLLIERIRLIEHEKECPEELKEAVATLIFASSRCGDFPELQQIRSAFYSHYGKEFVTRSVELRNQCGVNTKMIQKMSTLAPSMEAKTKLLNEIAAENNIVLHPNQHFGSSQGGVGPTDLGTQETEDDSNFKNTSSQSIATTEFTTDSFKARQKYKDVTDAAQDAFEKAAYAAVAARAAVELSRTGGPKRWDEELMSNFDGAAGSLDEVVVVSSSPSMKLQIKSRLNVGSDTDPQQVNVPRLNLDRVPISMRARRLSGY